MKVLSLRNNETKQILGSINKTIVVNLGILDCKEQLKLKFSTDGIKNCAKEEKVDITLRFKHLDYAFKVLTARQSIASSYKEKNIFIIGNIPEVMAVLEILVITQKTILPQFINRKLFEKAGKINKKSIVLVQAIFGRCA